MARSAALRDYGLGMDKKQETRAQWAVLFSFRREKGKPGRS